MNERSEALRGHAAMLLFAVLISISFTLGDLAAPHIDPAALTAARFALAVCVIGVIAWPKMRASHFTALWRFPLLGGLMAGYFITMFEALQITDPISTGAVFTLTPVMSAGFAFLLMRQITTPVMAISLLLAALGAIWVIFRADVAAILGLALGRGEAIFLTGCAMHALYTPLVRMTRRDEPVLVYTFATLVGGLVVTAIYGAGDVVDTWWSTLPWVAWAAIVYLGVATTAFTFFLVQYATLRLPSAKVMAYGYLVPSFVIIQEGVFGHGWVAPAVWLGAAATVAALLMLLAER